ncbi:thioesterase domain-containing protein, partial [Tateyamaria omphalii]|uniref:thioesterase domain-containing protein n=1 Tax=Tateyamaria omphalii TaxID=299262 RepID=UPI0016721B0A
MQSDRHTAAANLIHTLSADGIRLWGEGDKLKFWSPRGPLSDAIMRDLKALKPELLLLTANGIQRTAEPIQKSPLIWLQEGSSPPLYCIHSISGGANFYNKFDVKHLPNDGPIEMYGVSAMDFYDAHDFPENLEALATWYADDINQSAPDAPLLLCGYSMGGNIAFEMARQLSEVGREIALVVLIDSPFKTPFDVGEPVFDRIIWTTFINICLGRIPSWIEAKDARFFRVSDDEKIETILNDIKRSDKSNFPQSFTFEDLRAYHAFFLKLNELRAMYRPQPYDGNVVFLSASQSENTDTIRGWSNVSTGTFTVRDIPGAHNELFRDQESLDAISTCLSEEIGKAVPIEGAALTPDKESVAASVQANNFPASHEQKRLWYQYRANRHETLYNITRALELLGVLDASALSSAFLDVL